MDYYSAIKRNEPTIQATIWMNFRIIRLSVRGQTKKNM